MIDRKFPRVTEFFGRALSIDNFELISKLGKGSFGYVSLYRHIQSGKYSKNKAKSQPVRKKQNYQPESNFNNEHIIQLVDHFEDKDAVYLITQFIKGANLYDQTLKNSKHLPVDTIAQIIHQVCQGLQELHSNHIIHRDIKLQNLMYNEGVVKIVDLGCSNFYGDNISRHTTIGTKLYWSPEIIAQEQQNDRLDIWCLGVVLYELLYLEEPFTGNDIERKIRKYQYGFPNDHKPQPELQDLFKRIFTHKNTRIKASEMKKHPWIKKYRKGRETVNAKFQQFFSPEQTAQYSSLLKSEIGLYNQYVQEIKGRTDKLQFLLKQARRQLKKK